VPLAIVMIAVIGGAGAAAAEAPPTVQVSKTTELFDGETVRVSVTGLEPGGQVGVGQCANAPGNTSCVFFLLAPTTPAGTADVSVVVQRKLPNGIDCAVEGACVVRVIYGPDLSEGAAGQVDTPIQFVAPHGSALTLDPESLVAATDGSGWLTGTITCDPEMDGVLSAQVQSSEVTLTSDSQPIHCSPERSSWSLHFASGLDAFPAGPVNVAILLDLGDKGIIGHGTDVDLVRLEDVPIYEPRPEPTTQPSTAAIGPVATTLPGVEAAAPVAAQPTFTG
jgi:hypothetical protein